MSVYGSKGRLKKIFGKDKLYFPVPSYWRGKFIHHIKRMLVENEVIDRTDYDLEDIHELVDDKYIF